MKEITTQFGNLIYESPDEINFQHDGMSFYRDIYCYLYRHIDVTQEGPHIDFDTFRRKDGTAEIDLLSLAEDNNIQALSRFNQTAWRRDTHQKAMLTFMSKFPETAHLIQNISLDADVSIECAEKIHGEETNSSNFIKIKKIIDAANRRRWNRGKTTPETQSGNTNVGRISETLLDKGLRDLLTKDAFFKVSKNEMRTYGDFVLMCMPNNLWVSVKSNYARERLVVSGPSTDIIGVGFFVKYDEFTSNSKIRNYKRRGFLGIYLPDIPVSEEQIDSGTNTYSQIISYFENADIPEPENINDKPFFRRLSDLRKDLLDLLDVSDISKRHTMNF